MRCRCNDIMNCEQDIRLLTAQIAQGVSNIQKSVELTTASFPYLTQFLNDSVYLGNRERVSQRFSDIKTQNERYVQDLQTRRLNELARARTRLSGFEIEDRSYHEMLDKKQK